MSGIIWLASYPKSGNTWLRIFLYNYIENTQSPAKLDEFQFAPIATSRTIFDDYTGVDSMDLTADEIDCYRPRAYREYAKSSTETIYSKVHDAYTYHTNGSPIFPPDATNGVIYIVRNPLDVAVSYASHNHSELDSTIKLMGDACTTLAAIPHLSYQLHHVLLSWSEHIRSWLEAPGIRRLVVRYEDMISHPLETFGEIVRFIPFEEDADRLRRAVEFSNFSELQKQEKEVGFKERSSVSPDLFFRKGKVGGWRTEMTEGQVEQIVQAHAEVMRQFGYLTPDGQIVY